MGKTDSGPVQIALPKHELIADVTENGLDGVVEGILDGRYDP